MFLQVDPKKLRYSKLADKIRMASHRISGSNQCMRIVIYIPPVYVAQIGTRLDVDVGALGTPDEGMIRLRPGTQYTLVRDRKSNWENSAMCLRISISRGLPVVKTMVVKAHMNGNSLLITVPRELRPHYEDIARKAERIAVIQRAFNENTMQKIGSDS